MSDPLTLWPTGTTTAGADTAVDLSALASALRHGPVRGVRMQNNSGNIAYLAYDSAAAPGTIKVPDGSLWTDDVSLSVLHVYTPGAVPINGASPGLAVWGIV